MYLTKISKETIGYYPYIVELYLYTDYDDIDYCTLDGKYCTDDEARRSNISYYTGMMQIRENGCTANDYIVLKGKNYGSVWSTFTGDSITKIKDEFTF